MSKSQPSDMRWEKSTPCISEGSAKFLRYERALCAEGSKRRTECLDIIGEQKCCDMKLEKSTDYLRAQRHCNDLNFVFFFSPKRNGKPMNRYETRERHVFFNSCIRPLWLTCEEQIGKDQGQNQEDKIWGLISVFRVRDGGSWTWMEVVNMETGRWIQEIF